jgi:hypothetical protein
MSLPALHVEDISPDHLGHLAPFNTSGTTEVINLDTFGSPDMSNVAAALAPFKNFGYAGVKPLSDMLTPQIAEAPLKDVVAGCESVMEGAVDGASGFMDGIAQTADATADIALGVAAIGNELAHSALDGLQAAILALNMHECTQVEMMGAPIDHGLLGIGLDAHPGMSLHA